MLFTEFYCPNCDSTFHVRYAIEQDVSDIDFAPCCGHTGRLEKKGVTELDGLLVSLGDVKED